MRFYSIILDDRQGVFPKIKLTVTLSELLASSMVVAGNGGGSELLSGILQARRAHRLRFPSFTPNTIEGQSICTMRIA